MAGPILAAVARLLAGSGGGAVGGAAGATGRTAVARALGRNQVVDALVGGDDQAIPNIIVTVEGEKTLAQFDQLIANIKGLQDNLPVEFEAWQREDMNRTYPEVRVLNPYVVETSIFPRSRRVRRKEERSSSGGREKKRRRVVASRSGGSQRPILRPVLMEMLCERMSKMLKEGATWQ
jgi:hypothetical protein